MRVQMPESSHERALSGQVNTQLQATATGFNNLPAGLIANPTNNAPTVKDRFGIQRTITLHRADISCRTVNKNHDSPDRDSMFKRLTSIEKGWNTGYNQTQNKPSADTGPEHQEKAKHEPLIQVPESRPFINRFQGCQRTKSLGISKPHFQQQTLEGADHQAVRPRNSSVISFARLSVSRGGILSKQASRGSIQKQSICSSASSIESFFQESCLFVLPATRDPRLKPKNNANPIKTFDSAVGVTKTVFHGIGSKQRLDLAEMRGSPTFNFVMRKKRTEGSKMEARPLATKAGLIEAEKN